MRTSREGWGSPLGRLAGGRRPRAGRATASSRRAKRSGFRCAANRAVIVPLTTQLDALRFPGTILLEPDAENGLRQVSVALVFQMAALDQRFVGDRLGSLLGKRLKSIWAAFDEITEGR